MYTSKSNGTGGTSGNSYRNRFSDMGNSNCSINVAKIDPLFCDDVSQANGIWCPLSTTDTIDAFGIRNFLTAAKSFIFSISMLRSCMRLNCFIDSGLVSTEAR